MRKVALMTKKILVTEDLVQEGIDSLTEHGYEVDKLIDPTPEELASAIAPYDALSIILSRRQSKIPYFWCRIATDSICAIAAALLGGVIGIGTLICALGLGPFITFFDRLISRKLCGLPT